MFFRSYIHSSQFLLLTLPLQICQTNCSFFFKYFLHVSTLYLFLGYLFCWECLPPAYKSKHDHILQGLTQIYNLLEDFLISPRCCPSLFIYFVCNTQYSARILQCYVHIFSLIRPSVSKPQLVDKIWSIACFCK